MSTLHTHPDSRDWITSLGVVVSKDDMTLKFKKPPSHTLLQY